MLLFYKNRTFKCNTNNVYGNVYIINDILLYDIHTYNMYTVICTLSIYVLNTNNIIKEICYY